MGRFSCGITPWFASAAYADRGCPDSIKAAMNDAEWAADRWAEINGGYRTTGLYYDANGQRHKVPERR